MRFPDLRLVSSEQRQAAADRIKASYDVTLPQLSAFNFDPCVRHEELKQGCRDCGVTPRRHQRTGASWIFMRGKGLIADPTGSGKTCVSALLLAMMKEAGEFDEGKRAVVVCRASAVRQWVRELHRMVPGVMSEAVVGPMRKRLETYSSPWEVLVMSKEMCLSDVEALEQFKLAAMIVDDCDNLRRHANKTSYAIKRHARRADRVLVMNATPLHKRLEELWSVLDTVGGADALGNQYRFKNRYVQSEKVTLYGAGGRQIKTSKVVGYKNVGELRDRIAPMILRRNISELDDVTMPAVSMNTVWLELHPRQRAKYEELRKGVLEIVKNGRVEETKRIEAIAKFHYGGAVCSGLAAIGEDDGEGASSKLDWVMEKLEDDLSEEKVVIFCNNKAQIRALQHRMNRARVGHVTIWGEESNATIRQARIDAFWDDPGCHVLMGTSSIESSLNLHVSRHLILIDSLLNPARMMQLAGRVKRQGSAYETVYVHHLICENTQEEFYIDLLQREQAISDFLWKEENELFEAISPLALLQLIVS